jgi:hypothetical protein
MHNRRSPKGENNFNLDGGQLRIARSRADHEMARYSGISSLRCVLDAQRYSYKGEYCGFVVNLDPVPCARKSSRRARTREKDSAIVPPAGLIYIDGKNSLRLRVNDESGAKILCLSLHLTGFSVLGHVIAENAGLFSAEQIRTFVSAAREAGPLDD